MQERKDHQYSMEKIENNYEPITDYSSLKYFLQRDDILPSGYVRFIIKSYCPKEIIGLICKYCYSLSWSRIVHGPNVEFVDTSNDKGDRIIFKKEGGMTSIAMNAILSSKELKSVTYSFKVYQFAWYSFFGFLSYPMNNFHIKWDDHFMNNADNYVPYAFGATNNNKEIITYPGNNYKSLKYMTKNGDKIIFDFDFDKMVCNVYINEINETQKAWTWNKIPSELVPTISHNDNPACSANQRTTDVSLELISFKKRE